MVAAAGRAIFQNMGQLCFFTLLMTQWAQGEELKTETFVPILAIVLFLFSSVNSMTFMAMNAVANLLAVL